MTSPPQRIPEADAEQLARYLLGELTPAEQADLDVALLDDEVWQAAQRAEDDLLDAYANGQLGSERRERLTQRIAASPRLRDRVVLHGDLRTIARARHRRARPPRSRMAIAAFAVAVAAALVVVVAVRGADREPAAQRGAEIVALDLVPATRGGELPVVNVAGRSALAVSVAIDAEEAFPRYRVRIAAWSQDNVIATDATLVLRVPVAALADGVHELEITGIDATGAAVRLGTRSFRVVR